MSNLRYCGVPDPAPGDRVLNGVNLTRITAAGPPDSVACAACHRLIETGEPFTWIRIGPGPDPEERKRAREGCAYNAVRVPIHWACATGEEDA